MKPITIEKRELIINAKERGEKESDIARWLDISKSAVASIWGLFRRTNSIAPKPYLGRKPVFTDDMKEKVVQRIKEQPDMTLEELIDELELPIQKSRLSEWLIERGLTYKKKRSTQRNNLEKTYNKSEKTGVKRNKP